MLKGKKCSIEIQENDEVAIIEQIDSSGVYIRTQDRETLLPDGFSEKLNFDDDANKV